MNKKMITKSILAASIAGMSLFSCSKSLDIAEDQMMAQDNALAEQSSEEVNTISDQVDMSTEMNSFKNGEASGILSGEVKVDKDKVKNKTTIDFGDAYLAKNGKTFSGKMIKTTNGKKYYEDGFIGTITYENFKCNGNSISGSKTIEYKGLDADGNRYWTITINHQVIKANGKSISYQSTKVRTQIAGAATTDMIGDDIYKITGSGLGTASNGMTFEFAITKPVIRNMSCKWRTEGTIEYSRTKLITRTRILDYGNGTCDAIATVIVDGQTREISLD